MSKVLDASKVDAALQRAATAGVSGELAERAGKFDLEHRYIAALGEREGEIVVTLICDYLELRDVWQVYSELFEGDNKTVDLLNWCANETFGIVQEELQKILIVRIYRFFDKPSNALSFERLSDVKNKYPLVRKHIDEAKQAVTGKFANWRHEQVAHRTLSVALQKGPPKAQAINGGDMRFAIEKIGTALSSIHNSFSPGIELAWPQSRGMTAGLRRVLHVAHENEIRHKRDLGLGP